MLDTPGEDARALIHRVGLERTDDLGAPLTIEPYEHVCHRGALRAAVLASATDVAGSLFARASAGVEAIFTTDLSLRARPRSGLGAIRTRARLLHATRKVAVTELCFARDGEDLGRGIATFKRIPASDPNRPTEAVLGRRLDGSRLAVPVERAMRLEVVDAERGHVALEPHAGVCNPNGSLQGTAVAIFVEVAALARAERELGPRVASELEIRYHAASGRGPLASSAEWTAGPGGGVLFVELRDAGNQHRLTASAFVRCEAPPDSAR